MDRGEQRRVAVLERCLDSLPAVSPPTHPPQEKIEASNFSEQLQQNYCPTKQSEILRSFHPQEPHGFAEARVGEEAAVEIHWTPVFGRYLVAARDIAAGEVVFREAPLVVGPKAGAGPTCLACLKTLSGDVWEGCKICGAPLCQPQCGGNGHSEEECELLALLGLKDEPKNTSLIRQMNAFLAPLRTLLLMEQTPAVKAIVDALQSHVEERRDLPIGRFVETHVVAVLRERLHVAFEAEEIRRVCGVCDTNSYQVSEGEDRVGRALFAAASLMNHSCTANTQHWYQDGVMTVRAVVDIPEGAPVTYAYTNVLWGTRARAAHLATAKLFTCECERCVDPTELGSYISSVKCRECPQGLLLPPSATQALWQCQACGASVPPNAVETLLRAGGAALGRLLPEDAQAVAATLGHLTRILGDTHYIVVEVKHALVRAIMASSLSDVTQADLEKVLDLTSDLLRLADRLQPGLTKIRGILMLERSRALVELLRRCDMKGDGAIATFLETQTCNILGSATLLQTLTQDLATCETILLYDSRLPEVMEVRRRLESIKPAIRNIIRSSEKKNLKFNDEMFGDAPRHVSVGH
ncbi:SET domain-containing protein SmydA-8-like [Penaeus japonicus]|uniref:SET domain-containing protein SmydA-8-like n=1 Tax=Penaeus japonicus TaxID=27405 RepID=UPI001C710B23|nr:SET domain-containing protein SmydA-8-like [Penaeus japonicus]